MTQDNARVLADAYAAFGAGNIEKVAQFIADDSVWHIRSTGGLDGDYKGRDEVLGFLGRLMQETGGSFKVEPHDILASGKHAVALNKASMTRNGRSLQVHQTAVYQMANGQTTEAWFHYDDEQAVNDLFS